MIKADLLQSYFTSSLIRLLDTSVPLSHGNRHCNRVCLHRHDRDKASPPSLPTEKTVGDGGFIHNCFNFFSTYQRRIPT